MSHITYEVVQHNGGWAYKVGDVFSETFPSHEEARAAAETAAARQELSGSTEATEYQDSSGEWRREVAPGTDRPETDVSDEDGQ